MLNCRLLDDNTACAVHPTIRPSEKCSHLLWLNHAMLLNNHTMSIPQSKDICYILLMVGAIDRAHARSTSARNVLLTVRMRTVNKCVKCAADRAHAPL